MYAPLIVHMYKGVPFLLNGQGRVQERLVARPDLDRELARLDHPLAVQRPEAELRRVHADRHRLRRAGPSSSICGGQTVEATLRTGTRTYARTTFWNPTSSWFGVTTEETRSVA